MRSRALKRSVIAIVAAFLSIGIIFWGQPAEIMGAAAEGSQASSNAKLKSLSVSTGTMSPEFSPETTSYTITVAEDVEKINVTCSTDDINARVVEAGGFKNLKPGSNNAVITVMAADGTKCTYNLIIIRGSAEDGTENEGTESEDTQNPDSGENSEDGNIGTDAPEEEEGGAEGTDPVAVPLAGNADVIPVGGESIFAPFQVHSSYPAELLPEGFVSEDYNYKGYAVQSAYFSAGDIRLLYLSAIDGGSADFRIYYEDTDTFMDFLQLKGTDGKFIMPVRYQAQIKIPDNYTGSFMPWGDKVVSCFIYTELTDHPIKGPEGMEENAGETASQEEEEEPVSIEDLEEKPEFYLIFAMNNEGGESFYLYDYVEGTYQRYVERDTSYELDQSYFKYKDIAHQRFAIMCVLLVLLTVAGFCIVNLFMQNRELKKELEDDDEAGDEPDSERTAVKAVKKKDVPEKREKAQKMEKPQKPEKPERKEKPVREEGEKKEKTPEAGGKPVREKKAVKETKPVREARAVKEGKAGKQEVDTDSLEAKIIGQIQETEPEARKAQVTTARKPSNFKMINLSREPGPTGLDDDFEFEFINFDDE